MYHACIVGFAYGYRWGFVVENVYRPYNPTVSRDIQDAFWILVDLQRNVEKELEEVPCVDECTKYRGYLYGQLVAYREAIEAVTVIAER